VIPADEGVLVDAGYRDGSTVSTDYDAMLAKVVAWAPTREDATRRLVAALTRAELDGPPTNRDLLVRALSSDDFAAGRTDTGFVDRHGGPALGRSPLDDREAQVHAVAATLAGRERDRAGSPLPGGVPLGWRNVGRAEQPVELMGDAGPVRVVVSPGRAELGVSVDRVALSGVRVWSASVARVDLEVGGVRRSLRVQLGADQAWVQSPRGASRWRLAPRFPLPGVAAQAGSLRAPLPGRVVEVMIHPGDRVRAGQALVSLEAMKMEHTIQAPYDGTVAELHVASDSQVQLGQVLLVVEPDREGDGDG
jgi:propionyl-CoA carboxylase alpha chain